jgi:ficolin
MYFNMFDLFLAKMKPDIRMLLIFTVAAICWSATQATDHCDEAAAAAKKAQDYSQETELEINFFLTAARDCTDIYGSGKNVSGVYTIYLNGIQQQVYCDLTTPGGGWLVFQRRQDGSVDFYRDWRSYQAGFGGIKGEFWLGNEFLYKLTSSNKYKLRIDMADFAGETRYGVWSTFSVGSSASNYRLNVGGYSGNAGDAMAYQNQMQFSAFDRDVDASAGENCALKYRGAWWYNACHYSNLNGAYLKGPHTSFADGIEWQPWHDYYYSLKFTEMKIALAN